MQFRKTSTEHYSLCSELMELLCANLRTVIDPGMSCSNRGHWSVSQETTERGLTFVHSCAIFHGVSVYKSKNIITTTRTKCQQYFGCYWPDDQIWRYIFLGSTTTAKTTSSTSLTTKHQQHIIYYWPCFDKRGRSICRQCKKM